MRFVPEDHFRVERDVLAQEYRKHRDIGGGFSIKLWGEERFGTQWWDQVLPLMRDMRRALQALKRGEAVASFHLPDQPVTMQPRWATGRVSVSQPESTLPGVWIQARP